jgi:hypothetical protein
VPQRSTKKNSHKKAHKAQKQKGDLKISYVPFVLFCGYCFSCAFCG